MCNLFEKGEKLFSLLYIILSTTGLTIVSYDLTNIFICSIVCSLILFLSLLSVNTDNWNFNTTDTLWMTHASLLQLINHFRVLDALLQILLIKSLRQNLCVFWQSIIWYFLSEKEMLNYTLVYNLELNALNYFYRSVLLEGFWFSAIVFSRSPCISWNLLIS